MHAMAEVSYAAVGRLADLEILGQWTTGGGGGGCEVQPAAQEIFLRMLKVGRARLQAGQRQRLQWGRGCICCVVDHRKVCMYFLVVRSVNYPPRIAFQALEELMEDTQDFVCQEFKKVLRAESSDCEDLCSATTASSLSSVSVHTAGCKQGFSTKKLLSSVLANSLTDSMGDMVYELLDRYQQPGKIDKLCAALEQVETVRSAVNHSVHQAFAHSGDLEALEQKMDILNRRSFDFESGAAAYRKDLSAKLWTRQWLSHFRNSLSRLVMRRPWPSAIVAVVVLITLFRSVVPQDICSTTITRNFPWLYTASGAGENQHQHHHHQDHHHAESAVAFHSTAKSLSSDHQRHERLPTFQPIERDAQVIQSLGGRDAIREIAQYNGRKLLQLLSAGTE